MSVDESEEKDYTSKEGRGKMIEDHDWAASFLKQNGLREEEEEKGTTPN